MSSYKGHDNLFGADDNDFVVSVKDRGRTLNPTVSSSQGITYGHEVQVIAKNATAVGSTVQSDDHLVTVQPARKIWDSSSHSQSIFEEYSERRKNENDNLRTDSEDVIAVVVRNRPQQSVTLRTQSAALGLQFQIDPFTEPSVLPNSISGGNETSNTSHVTSGLSNTSSFFDQMEQTLDGVSGANQMSRQTAVDDFELKLKNMLSGRVPEEYAKKVENETNPIAHTVQNTTEQPKVNSFEKDSSNPHAFFDQISQARSQARVMDLGAFKANLDFLDSVDQSRELERQAEKSMNAERIKSMGYSSQIVNTKPIEIPDAVTMTSMDWVEDLAQVTVEPKVEALAATVSKVIPPTIPLVQPDASQNTPTEQPVLTDPNHVTTICVCADLPKRQ